MNKRLRTRFYRVRSRDCNLKNQLLLWFRGIFLDVIFAVFLLESLDSAGRVDEFLLAGIERMAHRADFRVDFLGCAAGLEGITTAAVYPDLMVFWMYVFFHNI
jgi:hypothetical protein